MSEEFQLDENGWITVAALLAGMVIVDILYRSEHGFASSKKAPNYPGLSDGPSHRSHGPSDRQHPNSGSNQSLQLPSGSDIDKLVNRLQPKTGDQIDVDIYPKTRTTGTIDVRDITAQQRAQRQRRQEQQRRKRRPDQSDHGAQEQYEQMLEQMYEEEMLSQMLQQGGGIPDMGMPSDMSGGMGPGMRPMGPGRMMPGSMGMMPDDGTDMGIDGSGYEY